MVFWMPYPVRHDGIISRRLSMMLIGALLKRSANENKRAFFDTVWQILRAAGMPALKCYSNNPAGYLPRMRGPSMKLRLLIFGNFELLFYQMQRATRLQHLQQNPGRPVPFPGYIRQRKVGGGFAGCLSNVRASFPPFAPHRGWRSGKITAFRETSFF